MDALIRIAETGLIPDRMVRLGIRRLLRSRLRDAAAPAAAQPTVAAGPIAVHTSAANDQHYELPTAFFRLMLGPRMKYSCCWWPDGVSTLDAAESAMLARTCERAELRNGLRVLDLGCGWGSLALWVAEHYPASRVTAVSNSATQQAAIRERAAAAGLRNLEVIRADVNRFEPREAFDRIVSVEMFEHVRQHAELLARIAGWLRPGGKLFVHLFCHRELSYPFELDGENDWMARYFFTGGIMPSLDMLNRLDHDLGVTRRWSVDGTHYERTLRAWLRRLDDRRAEALRILEGHYGADDASRWLVRWRLFLLACAELFGFGDGKEWLVGHYLLEPVGERPAVARDG